MVYFILFYMLLTLVVFIQIILYSIFSTIKSDIKKFLNIFFLLEIKLMGENQSFKTLTIKYYFRKKKLIKNERIGLG